MSPLSFLLFLIMAGLLAIPVSEVIDWLMQSFTNKVRISASAEKVLWHWLFFLSIITCSALATALPSTAMGPPRY